MPGQGERREPKGGRPPAGRAFQEQERRAQEPSADDRGDEGDEAGEQHERDRRSRFGRERLLVEVAAEQGEHDDRQSAERRSVEGRERAAAQRERPRSESGEQHEREGGRHRGGGEEPGARERRVCEDLAYRRSCPRRHCRSGQRPQGPAGGRSRHGDGRGLRAGVERELPAARAEPGESPPGSLGVAPHAHGGEHGEGEEERRGLAADEQQPPSGHVARLRRRAQLLDGSREVERARRRLEGRPGACGVAGEPVDLPGPHRPRLQRRHPGVAAVHVLELGGGRQPVDSLGEDERRRLGPVVAGRLQVARTECGAGLLVLGGHDEVAEEHRRGEHGRPDLDEAEPLDVRDPPAAAQPDDLAALGLAGAREAAGAQRHPAVEAVDRAEADVGARDGALPEEDERRCLRGHDAGERLRGGALEAGVVLVQRRQPEPGGPYRALGGRDLLDGTTDALVACDHGSGEDGGQHGRAGGDPGGGEERGRRPPGHPRGGEVKRVADPAERAHALNAASVRRLPPLGLLRRWLSFAYARRPATPCPPRGGPPRLDRKGRRVAPLHALRRLPAAGQARGGSGRPAARARPAERQPHPCRLAARRARRGDPRAARRGRGRAAGARRRPARAAHRREHDRRGRASSRMRCSASPPCGRRSR